MSGGSLPAHAADLLPLVWLPQHMSQNRMAWISFMRSRDPLSAQLPPGLTELGDIGRLCVARSLAPHSLVAGLNSFVARHVSEQLGRQKAPSLADALSEASPKHPVLITLAQGADPIPQLRALAHKNRAHVSTVSLGHGRAAVASMAIAQAAAEGRWVVLENCHLYGSYMKTVADIVRTLNSRSLTTRTDEPFGAEGRRAAGDAENEDADSPNAFNSPTGEHHEMRPSTAADEISGGASLLPAKINQKFRLLLTVQASSGSASASRPGSGTTAGGMPVALLHECVKISLDPPVGLRGTLEDAFTNGAASSDEMYTPTILANIDERAGLWPPAEDKADSRLPGEEQEGAAGSHDGSSADGTQTGEGEESTYGMGWLASYRRMVYAVCAFHAALRLRTTFGSRGFVAPYAFGTPDLSAALLQVRSLAEEAAQAPAADPQEDF